MFQLTPEEKSKVVAICDHLSKIKYSRVLPYAFTEHGAIMAAAVLQSPRAVEVSVFMIRAFVKIRRAAAHYQELNRRLDKLERHLAHHDRQILSLVRALRQATTPTLSPKRRIGFVPDE